MTNATPISLNAEAKRAFSEIKTALANVAYLAHPCENASLSLRTDASNIALGAILEQTIDNNTEVLGYFSKTLTDAQRHYSTYDLELLSVYSAVKYFEHILLDKSFTIYTDNKSLVCSFRKPSEKHTSKQVGQLSYLSQFDCTLQHLPGTENAAADCLSRLAVHHIFEQNNLPISPSEIALARQPYIDTHVFQFPDCSNIILNKITIPNSVYPLLVDTSLRVQRIVLPPSLENQVIMHYHSLSHSGINATHNVIRSRFVFKNMRAKVRDIVRSCVGCQRAKTVRHVVSPKSSIPMPSRRFQRINCDIAGPFPSSNGFAYILICIDPFTRWIEAFPMVDQTTCSVIQTLNFHMQYFGVPNEIHTDSGCQFTSNTFKHYCIFMGTNHRVSRVRYPASNGLAERAIKTVKTALTAKLDSAQWAYHLPIIVLSLNTTIKEDLDASPAELLYGQCLRLPGDLFISSDSLPPPTSAPELLHNMKKFASSLQPTSTRVNQSTPVYLPKALTSCSHVFIKDDPIHRNLTPAYSRPFRVVTRHEHTFTVLKGDKLISVNINNLKPGFVLSCPETHCNPVQPQPRPRRHLQLPQRLQDYVLSQ